MLKCLHLVIRRNQRVQNVLRHVRNIIRNIFNSQPTLSPLPETYATWSVYGFRGGCQLSSAPSQDIIIYFNTGEFRFKSPTFIEHWISFLVQSFSWSKNNSKILKKISDEQYEAESMQNEEAWKFFRLIFTL